MWADGLKVSTTESSSAEYQYKIFCRAASSYYLGNTTNATNSGKDYGLFAFYADESGDYTNGYYIYSIFEGKWVTYTASDSYSGGKNKISLSSDKPTVPWNIAADNTDNKYYDIRPFKTDRTVANMSWNWHGGAAANTSNTMGFFSYTDDNSGWGIVLAGGSGSPVADRKIVALYNVPTDENLYALYNSNGTPKVSNTTGTTPQYFVLRQNGLDYQGEALYKIQKAEGDGKYLHYQDFNTDSYNYTFLNTSSYFYDRYTYSSGTAAVSPYYNLFRVWPNPTDNSSRPYSNQVAQCNDAVVNMYSGGATSISAPLDIKGNWNGRWKIVEQDDYIAWQVVITGATESGSVTYKGSSLLSGATATQSNNGIFVISSVSTPTSSDFTINNVDGYLTDPTISFDSNRKLIKVAYTEYASIRSTIVNFLANTPETIGYPTSAARATLQAAIDAFDASSKVTSDLITLNTAYTTFQSTTDVNLPDLGKIYTIQNYIKSPNKTTYLKNENGTLTIGADASETALNNLWIVRKSGNTYVLQSAADLTKYIVYTSFTLAASGSTWTFSQGTEWPYISMYNSSLGGGRYVACNGSNQFGTAGGNNYYASSTTQSSGWSTDFKFVESEDYALYKVKIIYPSGSAPTVTYNETAYSNGDDFVAPTTLESTDLTASSITGYTANISINNDIIYVNYTTAFDYADTWNFDNSPWSLLNDTPAEIDNPSRTYRFNTKKINVNTTFNCSMVVKFAYTTGNYRIDVAGVDLLDPSTGDVVYYDYHDGYSGGQQSNREYTIDNVAPGNYILRYISYDQSTSSAGNISVKITPVPGFYRIKGKTSNKYLAAGSASNGKYKMTNETDATTIFYFDGEILTNLSSGMCNGVTASSWDWVVGTNASTVTFKPGLSDRGLAIDTSAALLYDNGDNSDSADRGSSVDITTSTNDRYCSWELTEITTLPITLKAAALGYATFCCPVPVKIPSGVEAYVSRIKDNTISLFKIENFKDAEDDVVIPANTAVMLHKSGVTVDTPVEFEISDYSGEGVTDNGFYGTIAAESMVENDSYYSLRVWKVDDQATKVGFAAKAAGGTLAGFKGWIWQTGTTARNFTIVVDGESDPTGIIEALGLQEDNVDIYDLNGRKLSSYKKGINIVNGKKVMVQ